MGETFQYDNSVCFDIGCHKACVICHSGFLTRFYQINLSDNKMKNVIFFLIRCGFNAGRKLYVYLISLRNNMYNNK